MGIDRHTNHHHHHEGGFFKRNIEIVFSIFCGLFLAVGFGLSFISNVEEGVPILCYAIAYIFGGTFTLREAYLSLKQGQFEIDFLMLVAAIGAAILGEWAEGALLLFLFSLGHALEHHALNKARMAITSLADFAPTTAITLSDGKQIEIPIANLKVNDTILIKPNTKIPADGYVIRGTGSVNQAPITGESIPVSKQPLESTSQSITFDKVPNEHKIFTGTINGSSVLEARVLRTGEDSTLSRMIRLVQESEAQKSPTQHFTDRFEKYFVPFVLLLVFLLIFAFLLIDESINDSFYRAMAVLVASSPCALAISTPSAVLAGVARAAKGGLLVKGGRPLENLGEVKAIAFDKTGTLTEGNPKLTHVVPFDGVSKHDLLKPAVAVEMLSDHPLAQAVVQGGKEMLNGSDIEFARDLKAITAKGIRAKYGESIIHIGNRKLLEELTGEEIPDTVEEVMSKLESEGHTAMIVHKDDQFLGVISVMDVARIEAKKTLAQLKGLEIEHMVMLTGDHQNVANAVARSIGITNPMGNLLPEDKVDAIVKLRTSHGKVAMVGDGVNDAPAMMRSSVGIAMGAAGSDVALETADIALMGDKLDRLPFAIRLSRKTKIIIKQNLWISLGMVAILVPLTILGIADIGPAVIGHEGSTLVVVLNALRLLGFKE